MSLSAKTTIQGISSMEKLIYLDNHATTRVDPRVVEAMLPCFTENFGNPSSHSHRAGLDAEKAVEEARARVALALNASVREITFCSGATESNNLVIKGVFEASGPDKDHIIISAIEHKCVLETSRYLARKGAQLSVLPVDAQGMVNPDDLRRAIRPSTAIVSVICANNEIGSLNPLRELASICRERGVPFHSDAAQAIGKIALDVKELPVDFLTASAHKFYGPKGVGFIFIRRSKLLSPLIPQIWGGGQEAGLRSGTLNVPGIVGMGKAIELCTEEFDADFFHAWRLRNRFWQALSSKLGDRLHLNGPAIEALPDKEEDARAHSRRLQRLPGNLNIAIRGLDRDVFFKHIRNLAVSYGSACASGDLSLSHVLLAIGLPEELIEASIRIGVGRFNSPEEIDAAAASILSALEIGSTKA